MTNRQARTLFSADRNLVLHNQFADVFESHGSLVQFDTMMLGQSVDQVRRGDRLGNAVLPATTLYEVIKEQGNDVVRLQEGSIGIDNAEAVGVAIGCNADLRSALPHLLPEILQQMI